MSDQEGSEVIRLLNDIKGELVQINDTLDGMNSELLMLGDIEQRTRFVHDMLVQYFSGEE